MENENIRICENRWIEYKKKCIDSYSKYIANLLLLYKVPDRKKTTKQKQLSERCRKQTRLINLFAIRRTTCMVVKTSCSRVLIQSMTI